MLKRRFDGKTIGSLFILMMMVCLSAFAGLRSDDVWTLNPSDFRYDMSLYFTVGSKDFEDLEAYEIGAFIGDECRGIAEKIELPEGGSYLYMRIRSNNEQPDEAVTFFARDKKTGKTVSLKGAESEEFLFKPDTMVGLPSDPFVLVAYYDVTVKAGEHGSVNFTDGSYAVGTVLKFEAMADEGYHFVGWSDGVEETTREITVSDDIELTASFAVSSFKVTFKIGDEVIEEKDVEFGTEIKTPAAAEKEGYTFAGWGEVPATMPAKDLAFEGSYTINSYKLTFKIGDEVIDTKEVEFGAQITSPEAPEKEGYTFAGWGEVPASMPAKDVEITGAYNVNSYKLTFKIGDEVIQTKEVNFGAEINAPQAPAKEGYTFAGWGEVPATMPAKDLTFEGSYTINSYKLTFKIGDEVIDTKNVEFGTEIKAPEAPEKEGYTFSGWGEVPASMPAKDLEITGAYTVNSYKLTFKIGDEVIDTKEVEFGAQIAAPQAPEKEGYTFAGWGEVPASMPAKDLEITGAYTVNSYKLTFKIGDEVIDTKEVEFGAQITAPEAPEKEGYTFAGWGEVPATMPAKDVEIAGAYTVNSYKLTFKIGDEVIETKEVNFGAEIKAPEAPAKEGYTFSGWGEVPASMPAKDLEFTGAYTVNSYKLTFKIGDEVIDTKEVEFGAQIAAPEAPEKEGYTFAGWGEVPATMPAKDVEITGVYNVNSYKLTFKIGEEVIQTKEVNFGAEINAPEAPAKEGYTFAGWGEVPATMPAKDLTFEGSYTINSYKLTFKIGDEVIDTKDVEFGAQIAAPEAPAKEGYTFSGWGEMPASMPAKDLEITGAYTVNSYKLTFKIGDEVIETKEVNFGAEIVAPEAPAKEGYTFSGWGEMPASMPAKDLSFEGSYSINSYKLTFKIGDEIIESKDVEFGAEIVAPEAPEKDGYLFDGWSDFPETMPAHDLVVTGTMSEDPTSSVNIIGVNGDENVTIYNLNGRLLFSNVKAADVAGRLTPGLYIINGKKVMVK